MDGREDMAHSWIKARVASKSFPLRRWLRQKDQRSFSWLLYAAHTTLSSSCSSPARLFVAIARFLGFLFFLNKSFYCKVLLQSFHLLQLWEFPTNKVENSPRDGGLLFIATNKVINMDFPTSRVENSLPARVSHKLGWKRFGSMILLYYSRKQSFSTIEVTFTPCGCVLGILHSSF